MFDTIVLYGSGTYVVPEGVYQMEVRCLGPGGAGADASTLSGAGGGGGAYRALYGLEVTKDDVLTYSVGNIGYPGVDNGCASNTTASINGKSMTAGGGLGASDYCPGAGGFGSGDGTGADGSTAPSLEDEGMGAGGDGGLGGYMGAGAGIGGTLEYESTNGAWTCGGGGQAVGGPGAAALGGPGCVIVTIYYLYTE